MRSRKTSLLVMNDDPPEVALVIRVGCVGTGQAVPANPPSVQAWPAASTAAFNGERISGEKTSVRCDAEVKADRSAFFTSDRVAVTAICRVGFGYPHTAALVRMRLAAS